MCLFAVWRFRKIDHNLKDERYALSQCSIQIVQSAVWKIFNLKTLRLTYCWHFQPCFTTYINTTKAHPGQLLPFWQFLVLEWTPPPHSALQWAQGPHGVHRTGRGQGFFSLHSLQTNKPCVTPLMCHADDISSSKFKEQSHLSSRPWPTQTRPPCRGDGLLHDRCRTSNPMPQLLLHWLQEDQGVQPPFLRGMKEDIWSALNNLAEFCLKHATWVLNMVFCVAVFLFWVPFGI